MSFSRKNILGIWVTTDSRGIILEYIRKYLFFSSKIPQKPMVIATPNAEQLVMAQHDIFFAKILNQADVALPDGFPVARFLNIERIPGVEFMEDLVGIAEVLGVRIGLIGGAPGVAVDAFECLKEKHPKLLGWGTDAPWVSLDQLDVLDQFVLKIVQKIRSTDTRMVFVGLGAPKQEEFIEALSHQLSAVRKSDGYILMSVGGSFDIIAGSLKRAPLLIRSIGFEWAWRLVHEPWRWKRQLALIKFVGLVVKEKLASKGDAFRS